MKDTVVLAIPFQHFVHGTRNRSRKTRQWLIRDRHPVSVRRIETTDVEGLFDGNPVVEGCVYGAVDGLDGPLTLSDFRDETNAILRDPFWDGDRDLSNLVPLSHDFDFSESDILIGMGSVSSVSFSSREQEARRVDTLGRDLLLIGDVLHSRASDPVFLNEPGRYGSDYHRVDGTRAPAGTLIRPDHLLAFQDLKAKSVHRVDARRIFQGDWDIVRFRYPAFEMTLANCARSWLRFNAKLLMCHDRERPIPEDANDEVLPTQSAFLDLKRAVGQGKDTSASCEALLLSYRRLLEASGPMLGSAFAVRSGERFDGEAYERTLAELSSLEDRWRLIERPERTRLPSYSQEDLEALEPAASYGR